MRFHDAPSIMKGEGLMTGMAMTKSGDLASGDLISKHQVTVAFTKHRNGDQLCSLLASDPGPIRHLIPVFLTIIAALEQAHRENTGLCDLDPQKVFLRDNGGVELSSMKLPASGMTSVFNSVKYCSPEMIEDSLEQPDPALIESYVLGFVFYEILLGRKLFEQQFNHVSRRGEFGWLTWHADKTQLAHPLSDLISGFPPVLSNLIAEMMAKEASARVVDFHKIWDLIGSSLQATAVITNLSALQQSEAKFLSVPKKIDSFWRNLMRATDAKWRNLPWGRLFPGRSQRPPAKGSAGSRGEKR